MSLPATLSMPNKQRQTIDIALVFLTVLLFYLAFPSGGLAHFAWIAIVPAMTAIHGASPKYAFKLGWLTATFGWMVSIWWSVGGLADIVSTSANIFIPFVFLFCALAALPYGISAWLHCKLKLYNSVAGAIVSALIFTVANNALPHLLPGNLAHALYLQTEHIQLASIGGVAVVFFILHCVNFVLSYALCQVKTQSTKAVGAIFFALAIFATNWLYGLYAIKSTTQAINSQSNQSLTATLVQPNIATNNRTRKDWLEITPQIKRLLDDAIKLPTDLLVLPEVPVPISIQHFSFDHQLLSQYLIKAPVLLAAIAPTENGQAEQNLSSYFNTAELFQAEKSVQQYHKRMLLPFGEYLPFEQQLPWLRELFPNAPNYQPGQMASNLLLNNGNENINIVPLICYEAVFTGLVADGINRDGALLVNLVNDAWFKDIAGKNIHLALTTFRAIEFRTPLVRVTNDGHSGVIDANGQLMPQSIIPPNQSGYRTVNIPLAKIDTFYQQYPAAFIIVAVFIILFFIILRQKLWLRLAKKSRPLSANIQNKV